MKIFNPDNAEVFLEEIQEILEEDEVNGNLILGISKGLLKNKYAYGNEDPFFSIVYNNYDVSLIGIMTPPYNLTIYKHKNVNDEIIELFINNLTAQNNKIPGITGEVNIAKIIVGKLAKAINCNYKIDKKLRAFKLIKVNSYNKSEGIFRIAENNDLDIIAEYTKEFSIETNEITSMERTKELAENGIKNKEIYVWEEKNIVAMAKKTRPTKHGMAISCVYTPKIYRNKGYATAVVSELSQTILDSGKIFCTLFTDLSNPTSNSIYQKIGYKPVCDNINYTFEYNKK